MTTSTGSCGLADTVVFYLLITAYIAFSFIMCLLVYCCKKPSPDDAYAKDRYTYTEYMGRWPLLNFLITALLLIAGSALSIVNPCGEIKPFTIDK